MEGKPEGQDRRSYLWYIVVLGKLGKVFVELGDPVLVGLGGLLLDLGGLAFGLGLLVRQLGSRLLGATGAGLGYFGRSRRRRVGCSGSARGGGFLAVVLGEKL